MAEEKVIRPLWRATPKGGWMFICAYEPCGEEMKASDPRRVIGGKENLSFCSRECRCRYEASEYEEFVCPMDFVCKSSSLST